MLTHPHQDHLAGLVEVLRRFQVKQVLYPDLAYDSSLYDDWLTLIEEQEIPATTARTGQQIDMSNGITIKVFSPETTTLTSQDPDIDNSCLVLRLKNDDISFLFTGDIRQEREWALIRQRADLASTVLKAAHHGSDTSTTAEFLAAVNPQVVIISAGADNKFGHPGDEVLNRLAQTPGQENVYRTDEQGTIEFIADGERLWVKTEE
ncbi:ComEC/Rec2 family competence protein [Chloroflexota bacterium]